MSDRMSGFRTDFLSSLVVFLVAVPLSLGIAVASGAPIASGLLAGIVGGIVVGSLSGAPLQVSGPAAGLTVLVFDFTIRHGFAATCAATLTGGVLQMVLSRLKVARIAMAISPAVVHGMLSGIGVLIVLGQVHVVLGGKPQSSAIQNLIELPGQIATIHGAATILGVITLAILAGWELVPRVLRKAPAPLVAVTSATIASIVFSLDVPRVDMPKDVATALSLPSFPSTDVLLDWAIFVVALTIVASAESLLCAVATDKLHDGPRANLDKELFAQGAGNFVSGLIGGLPITGVVVRSSANISSGARTRLSAILHGVWVLLFVVLFGGLIAHVPLAALAALLVVVGVRLVDPKHIRELRRHRELPTYLVTLAGVVLFNLLAGIAIGVGFALLRLLYRMGRIDVRIEGTDPERHVLVSGALTFVGVPKLLERLSEIPPGRNVEVEVEVDELDHAGIDALETWRHSYERSGGSARVELNDAAHEHVFVSRGGPEARPDIGPLQLIRGALRFQRRGRILYGPLLDSFAEGQRPHTLFITCSDSRIVPSLVTSTDPGELFLVRNVGNIVPDPRTDDEMPAELAAIEYAISVLRVSSIVICGHSSCGAMGAICHGAPDDLHAVRRWLQNGLSEEARAQLQVGSIDEAARQNVLLQLENIKAHPTVAERMTRGDLELFGWFYEVETGAVSVYSPKEEKFIPLRGPRAMSA